MLVTQEISPLLPVHCPINSLRYPTCTSQSLDGRTTCRYKSSLISEQISASGNAVVVGVVVVGLVVRVVVWVLVMVVVAVEVMVEVTVVLVVSLVVSVVLVVAVVVMVELVVSDVVTVVVGVDKLQSAYVPSTAASISRLSPAAPALQFSAVSKSSVFPSEHCSPPRTLPRLNRNSTVFKSFATSRHSLIVAAATTTSAPSKMAGFFKQVIAAEVVASENSSEKGPSPHS